MRNPRYDALATHAAPALFLAPPLQGRGWGGAVPGAGLGETSPTPNPSPEGEGLFFMVALL